MDPMSNEDSDERSGIEAPRSRPSVAIIGTRGYPSYYGGFETALRYLVPYLAEQGWKVSVYSREEKPESLLPQNVLVHKTWGVESKSLSTLSYGLTAAVDAAARKPDVALVMNVANGHFLPLLRARKIPTLVNVDGIEWEREKWGRIAKSVFLAGANSTARHATELVFDAHAIGDRWRSQWGRDGLFIPYGGEQSMTTLPTPLDLESMRYVLAVARFVPENSIPEFLDAVDEIADTTQVVLVGSSGYGGPLDDRARELTKRHSNFRWLGHVRDDSLLHALWQHAGVYFHGHSVGGTNPALVQAMALGAPTLARDTVFNREVLADAGEFWSDPKDIAPLAVRMLKSASTRALLRDRAIARAAEHYSWDLVCNKYESALRSLLPGQE